MKKKLLLVAAIFSVLIVAPVSAQQVEQPQSAREEAQKRAAERQQSREDRVAEIKKEAEARKIEFQKERCEAREQRLRELLPKLANGGERVKSAIDKSYTRVQTFYETGKLTVTNYQQLVDAIELAKANAESALQTVESYQFVVDCDKEGVGTQLDSYRTAVQEAREALKTYRKAVVDLISALRAEAAEKRSETQTTEGASNE
jgi:hypothetical protein